MPSPLSPADLVYGLTSVSSPSLSPDGARLTFVHSTTSAEDHKLTSRVMMIDTASGDTVAFTGGPSDSMPRWSPDGGSIGFLRKDDDGYDQVWVIPVDGGEARGLTTRVRGVVDYAWSPDASTLVISADVPDPEEPGPDSPDHDEDIPHSRSVKRIRYRYDSVGWRGEMYRHLFVVDVESCKERQLTDGAWDDMAPAWSPDGTHVSFVSGRRPDHDTRWRAEAYVVPASGGEAECWSGDLMSVSGLGWSPDSTRLCAVVTELDGAYVGAQSYQGIVALLGPDNTPELLTNGDAAPASLSPPTFRAISLNWSADDRIRFLASYRGQSALYEVSASGGDMALVASVDGTLSDINFSASGDSAAVLGTPNSPSSIALNENGTWNAITGYNRAFFTDHPPASMEKFTLDRAGISIESRVMLPPDFDPARKYPLILEIHGGPNGAFLDSFMPDHHIMATNGYVVLAVNPRGSSTYGMDFMTAVFDDWGGHDYEDIMAVVDDMASRPYIDADRMGLHGYSYGGFMATWAIGHTTRFKAALAGAPVTNLSSMYGTSDIGVSFGERQWAGLRMDEIEKYLFRSPISYVESVETPVLLIHGESDVRVPMEQSEQYYVSLKRLGKTVEFVRFPDFSHLSKRSGHPVLRQEYGDRMLAWFDGYLKG
ncbi:MAG TPA: S9 family peptidase [Dehalococcoidia bacterium]|nr:S9 family peptidase [Dehalococcoidia bacterium]MDP6274484.1 S9 family peptidase [Dehalococcoidia bacterium]MDP7160995.1 S9 family peptidase [Dehalococcoidia bacterium]MDP7213953.1 S9 family peptidase [Dehalococcoidia bacterium]MDP7514421.1 S9 family peptidase [Dehalococcoidia bacterium]|tara:strand:- start:1112 stop:3076 length:1965 start_codon:yes stop_codon:yes gene_type:complete